MILAEDLAIMDWNSSLNQARREARAEARAEGRAEGQDEIINLNKWLVSQNRESDIIRYSTEPEYINELFAEYNSAHKDQ